MPRINIGGTIINFPNSGTDANWAPAVIEFAQAVADVLASIASPFDISPRVQILTSDNNINININSVTFPSGSVRAFLFSYAIYRVNDTMALAETGSIYGVYDTLNSTWSLNHQFEGEKQSSGQPYHTFIMSGDQMQLSTVAIGGSYDSNNSKISYSAKTNLITDL